MLLAVVSRGYKTLLEASAGDGIISDFLPYLVPFGRKRTLDVLRRVDEVFCFIVIEHSGIIFLVRKPTRVEIPESGITINKRVVLIVSEDYLTINR